MTISEKSKKQFWYKTEGVLGKTFRSQKELTLAVRAIINPMGYGESLDGYNLSFMLGVLCHHPEWAQKCGSGIARIEKRRNVDQWGQDTDGFWIVRTDGTEVDISWVWAIKAQPMPYSTMVRDAARAAIHEQVERARLAAGLFCAACGGALQGQTHVDHAPPLTFEKLFTMWSHDRGDIPLRDAGVRSVFANEDDLRSWQEFHELFADLRVLHALCNLTQKEGK